MLNAGGEMPIALVVETGMFDGITLEGTDNMFALACSQLGRDYESE